MYPATSNMAPAHDTEVATSQHSEYDEFLCDPPSLTASPASSDIESSAGSEYERCYDGIDDDADIECIHENNEELRSKDAVKKFFEEVQNMNTLEDSVKRKRIGSLPTTMYKEPVPLFTDSDTGSDYQLHFSYTRMKGLHTYTSSKVTRNESSDIPDMYVHSLLHMAERGAMDLISKPNLVIPLGKLFVNKCGVLLWTGYELFVGNDMAIWMIYGFDEDRLTIWDPIECSLPTRRITTGTAEEGKMGESTVVKMACLWHSLTTLHTATFEEAADLVLTSQSISCTGDVRLLEIPMSEASRAVSSSKKPVHKIFETQMLKLNAESPAGKQLLALAVRVAKKPILKLKFDNQAQSEFDDSQALIHLANKFGDDEIIRLWYDNIEDDSTPIRLVSTVLNAPNGHLRPGLLKSIRSQSAIRQESHSPRVVGQDGRGAE